MLKLLHYPIDKYIDEYKVTVTGDILVLSIKMEIQSKYDDSHVLSIERSFTLNLSDCKDQILSLQLINEASIYEQQIISMYEFIDYYSNKKSNAMVPSHDVVNVARVIVNDDVSNVTILLDRPTSIAPIINCDIEHIEILLPSDTLRSKTSFLIEHDEFFKEKYLHYKRKSTLVGHIDYYNSIAYSEAQIDLLTRVLILLMNELEVPDEVTKLRELLVVANNNSVLDIKSVDSILKEFTVHKANMRKLQSGYYETTK